MNAKEFFNDVKFEEWIAGLAGISPSKIEGLGKYNCYRGIDEMYDPEVYFEEAADDPEHFMHALFVTEEDTDEYNELYDQALELTLDSLEQAHKDGIEWVKEELIKFFDSKRRVALRKAKEYQEMIDAPKAWLSFQREVKKEMELWGEL